MDGLGTLGFWLFLTVAAVAGVWLCAYVGRLVKEARLETARLAIESGQPADQALAMMWGGDRMRPDRKLRIVGSIMVSIGAGVAALGWFIGQASASWASASWAAALYGCGALAACIGLGCFLASALAGSNGAD